MILFMELYDSIINKPFLKAHAFLLDLFVCLQAVHDNVVIESRMCIVNEHFDKVALWYFARDSCCESFPPLQVISEVFTLFLFCVY